ncbi:phosphoglycerate kinase, partial [Candidatus Woesearchaeota archaeon]|nr:phosphoglycerate kinase [Candidatus Woesearchaeota archaeon]
MTSLKHLHEVDLKDKLVLLRADFNVPMRNGIIAEDSRIRKTLPTILHILDAGAKQVIITTHFGRPKGKVNEKYRVTPIVECLKMLLEAQEVSVGYADDCLIKHLPTQRVVLLENTRFYPEEKKNEEKFAKALAHKADVFVFDAFGTAHRDHASTTGVAKFIPELCIGLLMEKELRVLSLDNIPKPFKAIIGAAKVSDKIPVLESLLPRVDKLLLGGAIVFTFLKAIGYEVGTSLVEDGELGRAKKMYEKYKDKIILPVDVVISEDEEGREIHTV